MNHEAYTEQVRRLATEMHRLAEAHPRRTFSKPEDAQSEFADLMVESHEVLAVCCLDTRNRKVGRANVLHGSLNASIVRIGEVFREAIRLNAASVIVAHNHPSGDPSPSPEDVAVTRAIVEAGKLLDIDVLDHVIVSSSGAYCSLRAAGLGFL